MDPSDPLLVRAVGGGLMAGGMALQGWGRYHLRKVGFMSGFDLATIRPPFQPTSEGPYHVMTHPMYVGAVALIAGMGLAAWGGWEGAALALAALPHYRNRAVLEGALVRQRRQALMEATVAKRLFEEMSQTGTPDEPSQPAQNERTE